MNNQQYTERIVAFVDILGFRKMVNDSIVDNNQQMVIAKALDVIYGNKRLNDKFESDLIDAQVTVFSTLVPDPITKMLQMDKDKKLLINIVGN